MQNKHIRPFARLLAHWRPVHVTTIRIMEPTSQAMEVAMLFTHSMLHKHMRLDMLL